MSDDTLRQGKRHEARNWAIWRASRVDGASRHDIAKDVGLHPSRVWMIIQEYDALAWQAVRRSIDLPAADAVRDGLLGVEFVFTHEARLDADDDRWNWVNNRIGNGHAMDEWTAYRVVQGDDA